MPWRVSLSAFKGMRYHLPKLARLCLTIISLLALFAVSFASARMLEGKIEHSESLPPAEASLRPGSRFEEGAAIANSAFTRNHWFRVPNWLAGSWHYDERTTLYEYDYSTRQTNHKRTKDVDIATRSFGQQMDPRGNIWQFDQTPYTVMSEGGDAFAYTLRTEYVPVELEGSDPTNSSKFTVRILANQLRVDKVTNTIKDSLVVESIQTFSPEPNGTLRLEYSEKVFDFYGHPHMLRNGFVIERKVANFTPVDLLQGQDLKRLFQEFLAGNPF
jgi:hypothetical protein